jgi:hypothetical protein
MRRKLDVSATVAKLFPNNKPTGLARKVLRSAAKGNFKNQRTRENLIKVRTEICQAIVATSTDPGQKQAAQAYLDSLRNK